MNGHTFPADVASESFQSPTSNRWIPGGSLSLLPARTGRSLAATSTPGREPGSAAVQGEPAARRTSPTTNDTARSLAG